MARRALVVVCVAAAAWSVAGCSDDVACRSDPDCGPGSICLSGVCRRPCVSDDECIDPSYHCEDGVCVPGARGDGAAAGDGNGDSTGGDPLDGRDDEGGDPLVAGDPVTGDPVAGDPVVGDPVAGDPVTGGDPWVEPPPLMSIHGGGNHTCGLTPEGEAYCWGWDNRGQLGIDGSMSQQNTPRAVSTSGMPEEPVWLLLTGAGYHTCGLTDEHLAYCWGADDDGQLGENADGNNVDEPAPSPVDTSNVTAGTHFVALDAGDKHTCGIANDGAAYCWGSDADGQLGEDADGDNEDENIPVRVDTSALAPTAVFDFIMAAGSHTCAIDSNDVAYCWGRDSDGKLGENADGDNLDENVPVPIDTSALNPGTHFVSVQGGHYHTCGLANDGVAYCWGSDMYGQLGETGDGSQSIPVAVDTSLLNPGTFFLSLHVGAEHTCGLANDTVVYCWGRGDRGQLGNGTLDDQPIPFAVDMSALSPGEGFSSLATGRAHTCGISTDGVSYCWGRDDYGQLGENGDGDNLNEPVPTEVTVSGL